MVGLFQKHADRLLRITVDGEEITVTDEHPFYVDGEGWVLTGDLRVGDPLLQRDGTTATIDAIVTLNRGATVFTFEVAGDHNYYITTAQLLVHNCRVNLASPQRTEHILDGEVLANGFSGGHRSGTGFPGKSEFPAHWSDERIMHEISDVATDPSLVWRPGPGNGDFWVNGTRGGVDIEVLLRKDQIWTAYPTNLGRNPL